MVDKAKKPYFEAEISCPNCSKEIELKFWRKRVNEPEPAEYDYEEEARLKFPLFTDCTNIEALLKKKEAESDTSSATITKDTGKKIEAAMKKREAIERGE